ncbi:unnamed protein product [Moneuplotes crassus]|uniref:Uncharacterized protein n=1 Tax=Euplotes crassus TaxID=5936 RepID=A0AAD1Y5Z0_EUPCR|nr:unnamed protein product [Moneuplotes crassus]
MVKLSDSRICLIFWAGAVQSSAFSGFDILKNSCWSSWAIHFAYWSEASMNWRNGSGVGVWRWALESIFRNFI